MGLATKHKRLIMPLITTLLLTACTATLMRTDDSNPPGAFADAIYLNGQIYTVDEQNSWQQAMAIADGRFMAVGSNDAMANFANQDTKIIDLAQKMVMPGIQDMHLHPMDGGIKDTLECSFAAQLTSQEIVAVVKTCVTNAQPGQWIQGGQWGTTILEENTRPNFADLDAVSPLNPVFLMDWSVHNAWINSQAMQVLDITRDTPDPLGGEIVRHAVTGEATGFLLDNAAYEARKQLPDYSAEQLEHALSYSIDQLVGFGVTSFRDAITTERNFNTYVNLDTTQGLKTRVKVSLPWKSAWSVDHAREVANITSHAALNRPRIDASFAKIMLDGVPLTYTSAVLEPYEDSEQYGNNHRGELMIDAQTLAKDVIYLDAQGMTVKLHATGDRAVRAALDAIAAARKTNGNSGLRHEISHAEMIHPSDIPRFAQLNVAAEMCPILWYPNPAINTMRLTLGKRAEHMWPTKTLHDSGALVFYGSDWPAVVPNTNPWPGIEALVTRMDPYEQFPGALWPEQAVNLTTALRIFTVNGAIAGKHSQDTGSIEAGKFADFIVLNHNLFEIPASDISETIVLRTIVEGQVVYQNSPTSP